MDTPSLSRGRQINNAHSVMKKEIFLSWLHEFYSALKNSGKDFLFFFLSPNIRQSSLVGSYNKLSIFCGLFAFNWVLCIRSRFSPCEKKETLPGISRTNLKS